MTTADNTWPYDDCPVGCHQRTCTHGPNGANAAHRFDVTITNGALVERHPELDYVARNRLVDFAFRHDMRWCVRESDPEPQRRAYR